MKNILFINACVRPDSRTLSLAQALLDVLPGRVQEVRLYEKTLPELDLEGIKQRDLAARTCDFSDPVFDAARAFAAADILVIAAPYWDMMFPAVLKTYLENITVAGVTFRYSDKGRPESLCRAKQLHYVTTAGGYIGPNDFGFCYIKAMAQSFFGIDDIHRYTAEGLDVVGADVKALLDKAKAQINQGTFGK